MSQKTQVKEIIEPRMNTGKNKSIYHEELGGHGEEILRMEQYKDVLLEES